VKWNFIGGGGVGIVHDEGHIDGDGRVVGSRHVDGQDEVVGGLHVCGFHVRKTELSVILHVDKIWWSS